jgi:hypothetical protein
MSSFNSGTTSTEGVSDRGPSVDEEAVDFVDRRSHELVILRRRRRDLRVAGETRGRREAMRCPVEERADRFLRGTEPRWLDIRCLHRA